jgi:tetratricopeptide (TPR) repeat protein
MRNIHAWYLAFILAFALSSPAVAQPSTWSDWRHGVSGHTQALSAAERSDDPLVVYFHVDWCPWCRKLNERFLRNGQVRDTLSRMQRVEINPEKGRSDEALFKKYSGKGYPSFYVLVPGSGEPPVKLSPFKKSGEQSLAEFSDRIQAAVSGHYDRWAHRLHQGGDHARSLEVLERSLAFNPRNVYAHYLQGLINHRIGHEQRDIGLMHKAKTAYERALSLDPGHAGSRKGLDALRNL